MTTSKQDDSRAMRVTVPVVVGLVLLVLVIEPALSWFVVPAVLLGLVVALFLRSSREAPCSRSDEGRPEIQIARIPVKGGMGLVFTIGTIAIFCLGLPEARWFLLFAIPAGVVVGLALHAWHSRHV